MHISIDMQKKSETHSAGVTSTEHRAGDIAHIATEISRCLWASENGVLPDTFTVELRK
jgi:hypothetical protein